MKTDLMIYFENSQDKLDVTYKLKRLIRFAVEATLAYENYHNTAEVSVTFTDNAGIKELNKKYRNIDKETDVLSFPLFDFDGSDEPPVDEMENMLGDIVVSLEKAAAQADEFGHSFEREVAFLCVHSMLHLLGYDHEESHEDDEQMCSKQEEILNNLGITREK